LIDRPNGENIDVIADGLCSESDLTLAVLMGLRFGQGYFFSRKATSGFIQGFRNYRNPGFVERRSGGLTIQ
jgi:EAL domain-containing protein (putative c-di-GMP-specific phosphodiesterase class I)